MIVEYIRYKLEDHTADQLVAAYRAAAKHLEASPECLGFELSQCEDEMNVLILRIEWTSANAHMTGFRKGAEFPPFLNLIRPFIGEIAEMRHYELTDVAWQRQ